MERPFGFEPKPKTWKAFVLPLTPWTPVLNGGSQGARTLTAFTRTRFPGERDKPIFA
jgi:hypothetical protein